MHEPFTNLPNRRRASRIPVDLPVTVHAERSFEARISNLSASGAFVSTSSTLNEGQRLRVDFELNEERYQLEATVTRPDPGRGVGVDFVNVPRHVRLALVTFVARWHATQEASRFVQGDDGQTREIPALAGEHFMRGHYQQGFEAIEQAAGPLDGDAATETPKQDTPAAAPLDASPDRDAATVVSQRPAWAEQDLSAGSGEPVTAPVPRMDDSDSDMFATRTHSLEDLLSAGGPETPDAGQEEPVTDHQDPGPELEQGLADASDGDWSESVEQQPDAAATLVSERPADDWSDLSEELGGDATLAVEAGDGEVEPEQPAEAPVEAESEQPAEQLAAEPVGSLEPAEQPEPVPVGFDDDQTLEDELMLARPHGSRKAWLGLAALLIVAAVGAAAWATGHLQLPAWIAGEQVVAAGSPLAIQSAPRVDKPVASSDGPAAVGGPGGTAVDVPARPSRPQPQPQPEPEPAARVSPRVSQLLQAGDALFAKGTWSLPKGASALDRYREALELDPGNSAAFEGIGRICDGYARRADEVLAQGDVHGARWRLVRAIDILEQDRLSAGVPQREQRVARLRAALAGLTG